MGEARRLRLVPDTEDTADAPLAIAAGDSAGMDVEALQQLRVAHQEQVERDHERLAARRQAEREGTQQPCSAWGVEIADRFVGQDGTHACICGNRVALVHGRVAMHFPDSAS